MSRYTDSFWSHVITFNISRANRFLNGLSPLVGHTLVVLGLTVAGWLICSGLIDCWQLLRNYVVPVYQEIGNR
ncbi:hypothetical protein [Merismopedia glauca]|uniref:Uncharacterized protein n=1 Tax=Merismopedia glauca CCAP 1448/3 TaxID=1296344 RepID=A0A2T1C2N3_9CYAN|nr:hypothetical protein [Merismopedia glauca]PSB02383.1 hypothetical protein C7B64_13435 [Merismopedia glauca CCAP 1448/3]